MGLPADGVDGWNPLHECSGNWKSLTQPRKKPRDCPTESPRNNPEVAQKKLKVDPLKYLLSSTRQLWDVADLGA